MLVYRSGEKRLEISLPESVSLDGVRPIRQGPDDAPARAMGNARRRRPRHSGATKRAVFVARAIRRRGRFSNGLGAIFCNFAPPSLSCQRRRASRLARRKTLRRARRQFRSRIQCFQDLAAPYPVDLRPQAHTVEACRRARTLRPCDSDSFIDPRIPVDKNPSKPGRHFPPHVSNNRLLCRLARIKMRNFCFLPSQRGWVNYFSIAPLQLPFGRATLSKETTAGPSLQEIVASVSFRERLHRHKDMFMCLCK